MDAKWINLAYWRYTVNGTAGGDDKAVLRGDPARWSKQRIAADRPFLWIRTKMQPDRGWMMKIRCLIVDNNLGARSRLKSLVGEILRIDAQCFNSLNEVLPAVDAKAPNLILSRDSTIPRFKKPKR